MNKCNHCKEYHPDWEICDAWIDSVREGKMRVKLKSQEEFKRMVREGEVKTIGGSDSGAVTHYGTAGKTTHVLSVDYDEYGQEFLVVDHPNPISREDYERRKVFFKEER